eukprot:4492107-Pyramimonas_sp.AAC.1
MASMSASPMVGKTREERFVGSEENEAFLVVLRWRWRFLMRRSTWLRIFRGTCRGGGARKSEAEARGGGQQQGEPGGSSRPSVPKGAEPQRPKGRERLKGRKRPKGRKRSKAHLRCV